MSKNTTPDKVLSRHKKILEDVMFEEDFKSQLLQNDVFTNNTIEELFNVSIGGKGMTYAACIKD